MEKLKYALVPLQLVISSSDIMGVALQVEGTRSSNNSLGWGVCVRDVFNSRGCARNAPACCGSLSRRPKPCGSLRW